MMTIKVGSLVYCKEQYRDNDWIVGTIVKKLNSVGATTTGSKIFMVLLADERMVQVSLRELILIEAEEK